MISDIDASQFIGKKVKDENGEDAGTVISFLIDSSGQVKEALIVSRETTFLRCPLDRLKIEQDEVLLVTDIERRAALLQKRFPILQKKRNILGKLSENNEIPSEICMNFSAEFDKALADIKSETQTLLSDIGNQIKAQEELIKMLHLARTFLEMEHGIENVADEVYQKALVSLLKGINHASHGKINFLRIKDKVSDILLGDEGAKIETLIKNEDNSVSEPTAEKSTITVHVTPE